MHELEVCHNFPGQCVMKFARANVYAFCLQLFSSCRTSLVQKKTTFSVYPMS